MFINSLKFPYKYKVNPNEEEDLDRLIFDTIEKNIECALDRAFKADLKGDSKCSYKEYNSIVYYYILLEFIKIIKRYADIVGIVNQLCLPNDIYEHFKLDCVLKNLPCIGKTYGQNYIDFFKNGLKIAGIGFDPTLCEECCVGLGEMIIDDSNDCIAFIVGPCTENEFIQEEGGEFTEDEFINNERT